ARSEGDPRAGGAPRAARGPVLLPEGGVGDPRRAAHGRAARPRRHDRHRRPVPRDARDVEALRGPLRLAHRRGGRERSGLAVDGARALLRRRQGGRAGPRARGRRRVDHRHPPRAGSDARRHGARRGRPQAGDREVQPAGPVDRAGPLAPDPRAGPALPSAPRPGLRVHRLRAVHASGLGPRRALGGYGQDRMRAPRRL
ncbi:MAG: Adenylyl-sulfate reductase [thioredoxin], partial [uncultured Solirubrobacteraceae bacterium]